MQAANSRIEQSYYLETINELCEIARSGLSPYHGESLQIARKQDDSPVTEFDKKLELVLRECVKSRHPEDSIIGEEFGLSEGSRVPPSSTRWIIDPLDGTRAFLTGSPLWGTLVGVVNNGVPWLGAIEMPALRRRIIAPCVQYGRQAEPVNTSGCSEISGARLCTTTPDKFSASERLAFDRLIRSVAVHRYGGDCFNYAALATGRCDLVVESGLAPHDYLPIVPIVEAAGGYMTDWAGNRLTEGSAGDVVAAASARLHRDVLRMLREPKRAG